MNITTEAGAFFDNHARLKNMALLLDIIIVNPCAGSNLGNAARHVGIDLLYTWGMYAAVHPDFVVGVHIYVVRRLRTQFEGHGW